MSSLFLSEIIAASSISPDGRKNAVAESVAQVEKLTGWKGTAMIPAFRLLSVPKDGDAPPVAARRRTLAEIVAAAEAAGAPVCAYNGSADVAHWFDVQIDAFGGSSDPRQAAMAATAEREFAELKALDATK